MKRLLSAITFLFFVCTTLWAQQSLPSGYLVSRKLIITPQSQKSYLDSVAKAWEAHQITLKFTALMYNAQGKLEKVKGSVVVGPGKGTASGTFNSDNLVSIEVMITDPPGVSIHSK